MALYCREIALPAVKVKRRCEAGRHLETVTMVLVRDAGALDQGRGAQKRSNSGLTVRNDLQKERMRGVPTKDSYCLLQNNNNSHLLTMLKIAT